MAEVTLKGKPVHTAGLFPKLHAKAPPFVLVDRDLKDRTLSEFQGKKKLLATVPSLDTGTCSKMTKHFNASLRELPHAVGILVSADLPFAQKRFCEAEKVENVLTLSMMRDKQFGKDYGVLLEDGPLAGLLTRAVFVLDEHDQIVYAELVKEITEEPDYEKALTRLCTIL